MFAVKVCRIPKIPGTITNKVSKEAIALGSLFTMKKTMASTKGDNLPATYEKTLATGKGPMAAFEFDSLISSVVVTP